MLSEILSTFMKNLPEDQSRLLFSIMVTFPVGFFNNFIHGKTLRTIYGLFFGLIIQFYMFRIAALHVLISSVIILILVKFLERKKIGWTITIFAFVYLSFLHIYRMIYDYGGWSMDITTIFMSTVCKFSSFAFCYCDGEKKELSVPKSKYAIKNFTYLEYFAYIYFYPTCLMGPFFEFADFIDYIKEESDYKNIPKVIVLKNGIARLLLGFMFAAIYLTAKPYIGISFFWENLGGKYVPDILIFFSFYLQKYRYYIAFLFAESICYVSGLSFRRVNSASKKSDELTKKNHIESEDYNYDFQKVNNINILACEFTTSLAKFFQNWNISIHNYLKRYIHFRVYDNENQYKDRSKVIRAKTITFMVSGFWHGFYPSYYILFSHFAFYMAVEDNISLLKKVNESAGLFEKTLMKIFNFFIKIFFVFALCYIIGILDSLHIADMIKFMKYFYFIPNLIALLIMVFVKIWMRIKRDEIQKFKKTK